MNDIHAELTWRGLIYQATDPDNLPAWLNEQPRTVYAGFDPTADSLHIGHMLPLMMLRRFQQAGHRPVALVGGATGMIGDPTGKSQERNLLSVDDLQRNVAAIEQQMRGFLDFDGDSGAVLANNFDWMEGFSYLEFLRDIGKNFPVNVMLSKDSVKSRLDKTDSGLSYTEFSYMLLQAYDFVHLLDKYNCQLQIGGSDQWGNITAGIDLGRRMRSAQLFGITCPLLTKSDGTKMGKTESGALFLSPERTSPYNFYQYWINVDDADVSKTIRFLTELSEEEVTELDRLREQEPHRRASQKRLAEETTRLVHGEAGLQKALRATDVLHGGSIDDLVDADLVEIFADVPSTTIAADELSGDGYSLLDGFVAAGLAKSKGEARRCVQQGGAYINNRPAVDKDAPKDNERRLTTADLASETVIVLRSGKKKYALLRVQ